MGIAVIPAPSAGGKTNYRVMLTSGTSWTVPTGVTYIIATLYGGGGSGGSSSWDTNCSAGSAGQKTISIINTTPGASITYSIGAGGGAVSNNTNGNSGGNTTMTGATTASGGTGGAASFSGSSGTSYATDATNFGNSGPNGSGAGGNGWIEIDYWV